MNPLLQKAIEYAAHGYSVIPIRLNKVPIIPSWKQFQKTPADDVQLEAWWEKTPKANVGICTGKVSGITVVDIDTGGDKVTPLSAFPETYTVRTPTGGYHLYYRYFKDVQQTANTFPQFPHVDIRNDGGYVIAPPSNCEYVKNNVRIRGGYKVLKDIPLADFPAELFGVKKEEKTGKPSLDKILKGFPKMADGSGRNVALTKIVGKVLRVISKNDWEDIAWPTVLGINKIFAKPLEEKEVRTIFDSIKAKEAKKPWADLDLIKTLKGEIIANTENVYRTIKSDSALADRFRINTFTGLVESRFERTEWETLQRIDIIRVRNYLMSNYPHFSKVVFGDVEDGIIRAAEDMRVSPPVEWLESLTWDEKPRLDLWLSKTFGVEEDIYHKAVASNWLKGLVMRLVYPGSKFDHVLVLEGKQGTKKSTSLGILGGAWHVETVMDPGNKDFFMIFAGKAIVEFSEGETLSRTETKRLKAVITMQFDKYRPPYERAPREFPRQCVFAMTTNQEQYLKDETGNRRWLPVACKKEADVEWLKKNREQIFAEAYHRVVIKKETAHEFPLEETAYQQSLRQTTDPREELIYEWYFGLSEEVREQGISTRMAFIGALNDGFTTGKGMDRMEEMIIGTVLRETLHLEKRRVMLEGTRFYKYYPTKESEAIKPKPKPETARLPERPAHQRSDIGF